MQQAREAAQALPNAESSGNVVQCEHDISDLPTGRAIGRDWKEGDEVIVTALDHCQMYRAGGKRQTTKAVVP